MGREFNITAVLSDLFCLLQLLTAQGTADHTAAAGIAYRTDFTLELLRQESDGQGAVCIDI